MTLKARDGDSNLVHLQSSGTGTQLDPLIVEHSDPVAQSLLQNLLERFPTALLENKLATDSTSTDLLLESVRDRLIDIASSTDTLEALITALNGYVDAVEGLLTTANSTQTALSGFVDQLEGYTDGIETNQATQIIQLTELRDRLPTAGTASEATLAQVRDRLIELAGYTDTLETLLTSLNSYTDGLETLTSTGNATSTAISGFVDQLEGYTDGIEGNQATQTARLEAIRDRTPVLGSATSANSTPVVLSSDGPFSTNFGAVADTAATSDTGSFGLLGLIKRLLSIKLPTALSDDRFKVENISVSTARTTSFINTTTTGTIAAGANSVAIANIGSAAGTVKTVSLPAGSAISFGANGNDVLDSIGFVATSTNFLITTVV